MSVRVLLVAWMVPVLFSCGSARAGEIVKVVAGDGVVRVTLGGELFTTYHYADADRPYFYPVIAPTGDGITRNWPMKEINPDEARDHRHHRSLWFTHGDVNGISFWHEADGTGEIVHKGYRKVAGGETALICTENNWIGPNGNVLCKDVRTMTFGVQEGNVWIDFPNWPRCIVADTSQRSHGGLCPERRSTSAHGV